MLIYLVFIFCLYFAFVLACVVGWHKFTRPSKATDAKEFASVVVAVRNEEVSIAPLLTSLLEQDYAMENFEAILVDDHSTDATPKIIANWIKDNPLLKINYVQSSGNGKKHALMEGIEKSKGEILLTSDADCTVPATWISQMVMSFKQESTMVIGLVKVQSGRSLFSKIQAVEFSSVMGAAIAMVSLGFPIMCNGASLAFRKKNFVAANGYEGNLHIPSGDDEFLMRKLNKQFPGSIQSIRSASVVSTQPQASLRKFLHQRLRWASKWKANDSFSTKILALFVLVFQITYLVTIGLLFVGENLLEMSTLLGIKILLEGYFLFHVGKRLQQAFSIPAFFILQVVYPFYVISVGIFSQLFEYEWKGRRGGKL